MKRVLVLQHIWGDTSGSLSEMMRARDIPFDLIEVDKAPIPDGSAYWKEDTTQDDSATQTVSFWHIFA